ncbi:hypothetical protein JW711_05030 [Candidatus Woesearchaeota archaeon]|nr:hypothetical protein [Candidatus Woesearchaeota archaeon]
MKITILFLIVSMLPFLRSCGDVSYGFPAVAIGSSSIMDFGSYNPLGIAVNLAFVALAVFLAGKLISKRSRTPKWLTRALSGGIAKNVYLKSLALMAFTYHLAYAIIYAMFISSDQETKLYIVSKGLMLLLYPALKYFPIGTLEFTVEPFFTDVWDFKFRLMYLFSLIIYAVLTLAITHVYDHLAHPNKWERYRKEYGKEYLKKKKKRERASKNQRL